MKVPKQEKIKELIQAYFISFPDKHKEFLKKKEVIKEQRKARHREKVREYRLKHRFDILFYRSIWQRKRYREDENVRFRMCVTSRIYLAIKQKYNSNNIHKILGCSIKELKQHLEKQFTLGMNWKNFGFGWHIDHIKPCSKFDLTKEGEQKKCFHYTNLQPLWATENLKKNNHYTP